MIPYVYLKELINNRVSGVGENKVVYIEDDLYDMYDRSATAKYYDVSTPGPNTMYKGRILKPLSSKPEKPKCCCCCKGCCHE